MSFDQDHLDPYGEGDRPRPRKRTALETLDLLMPPERAEHPKPTRGLLDELDDILGPGPARFDEDTERVDRAGVFDEPTPDRLAEVGRRLQPPEPEPPRSLEHPRLGPTPDYGVMLGPGMASQTPEAQAARQVGPLGRIGAGVAEATERTAQTWASMFENAVPGDFGFSKPLGRSPGPERGPITMTEDEAKVMPGIAAEAGPLEQAATLALSTPAMLADPVSAVAGVAGTGAVAAILRSPPARAIGGALARRLNPRVVGELWATLETTGAAGASTGLDVLAHGGTPEEAVEAAKTGAMLFGFLRGAGGVGRAAVGRAASMFEARAARTGQTAVRDAAEAAARGRASGRPTTPPVGPEAGVAPEPVPVEPATGVPTGVAERATAEAGPEPTAPEATRTPTGTEQEVAPTAKEIADAEAVPEAPGPTREAGRAAEEGQEARGARVQPEASEEPGGAGVRPEAPAQAGVRVREDDVTAAPQPPESIGVESAPERGVPAGSKGVEGGAGQPPASTPAVVAPPKVGDTVTYQGRDWIVDEVRKGGILQLVADGGKTVKTVSTKRLAADRAKAAPTAPVSVADDVVYPAFHGSAEIARQGEFSAFVMDRNPSGSPRDPHKGADALGVWFTSSRKDAERYARSAGDAPGETIPGAVVEAHLPLRNPKMFRSPEEYNKWWTAQNKKYGRGPSMKSRELREELQAQGHDGIIVQRGGELDRSPEGGDWFVVFDPSRVRVKAVTGAKMKAATSDRPAPVVPQTTKPVEGAGLAAKSPPADAPRPTAKGRRKPVAAPPPARAAVPEQPRAETAPKAGAAVPDESGAHGETLPTAAEVGNVPKAPRRVTSARKTMTAAEREDYGLEPLDSPERRTWETALDKAQERQIPGRAMSIASEVNAKPRPLTDIETAGMVVRRAEIKNEHADLSKRVETEQDAGVQLDLSTRLAELEDQYDAITRAMAGSGTEKGRALAAQKLTIDQDLTLVSVKSRARAKAQRALTGDESEWFAGKTREHAEAVEAHAKKQTEAREQLANQAVSKAKKRPPEDFATLLDRVKALIKAGCRD